MVRFGLPSAGLALSILVQGGSVSAQPAPGERASGEAPATVVAVIDFTNSSLVNHAAFEAAETGVAALLLAELHGRPGIQLVERERLESVMDELALARSGQVAAATAARAGRLLGAHYVVTGVIMVDPGGTLRIDARAVDVETAVVVYAETVMGRADDLVDAVARLGARLDLDLPLRARTPAGDEQDPGGLAVQRRRADLSYARALQSEDRLDPIGAIAMYRAFLEVCPEGHAPALQARARARLAVLSATSDRGGADGRRAPSV